MSKNTSEKREAAIKANGGFLISKIKQIQGRVLENILNNQGIHEFNAAQGRILYVLWNEDNIPISELAFKTGLAKTTLTSMLDKLATLGYLERIYDIKDRRKINIRLTDTIRAMEQQYHQVTSLMDDIFYEGFSEAEIIQFEGYLERVLANLNKKEQE